MSIEGLSVNGLKLLAKNSHEIFHRTGQCLTEAKAFDCEECMQEACGACKRGGFTVVEMHCDNEFHKAIDKFAANKNPLIKMNYAVAKKHVPIAEKNNRVIKERVRANCCQLPFIKLPRTMTKYMVLESARKLSCFPVKHSVSKHHSPRMTLHQENLDYEKHCKHALGEYVQAHEDETVKNNNAPRLLDCSCLRPTSSHQGGHELLHLQINRVITRIEVTPVLITHSTIKQVYAIAEHENMPKGLKTSNRANVTLFNAS